MLGMLENIFCIQRIEIFFLFFKENMFWHVMQIVSNEDNLHDMSKHVFWKTNMKIAPNVKMNLPRKW